MKYEDYDEDDFYPVQGIITKVTPTSNPFDNPHNKVIYFDYNLEKITPLQGSESNINLMLKAGDPIIVLVYKANDEISFFGGFGIIDDVLKIENW